MYKLLLLTIASFLCVNPLFSQSPGKTYKDQYLQSLRVPIGGIGTGDILIGGRGNIEHVEIFNRSDRQRRLEKTFFALWTQKGEQPPIAKILEREIFPPFGESTHKYVAGLPRFRDVTFTNHFPLAKWDFQDESVPLQVSMDAFSPFIPLNVDESSYPLVAFYWELKNPNLEPVKGALVMNMENPIKAEEISNQYYQKEGLTGVRFVSGKGANVNYQGNVFLGTTASETEVQTHWYPGEWRDETHAFWDDFSDDGKLKPQTGDWETTFQPTSYNQTTKRMASVLVHFNLKPGQTMRIPMFLSWYFPQREFGPGEVFGIEAAANKPFGNAYGKLFSSEISVLRSFLKKETSLYDQTTTFANILQSSTYPESVKEALTTQAASIRTNLIQVTDKGNVHGFEGVTNGGWCCPGTCTHVWNYEQSLASLFPSLERNMREIEFLNNTFENGFQTHRSVLPIGDYWFPGPAAADGQMGTIVRAYRDWKFSGDDEWLRKIWPGVKRALEFAWTGSGEITEDRFKFQANQNAWDPQQTGLLSGKQHNTYDISFYGPSSMTTSLYLAALKAGAEMALAMGERKKAKEYESVYLKGNNIASDSLWNGEYFIQIVVDN
ncbi:MAG: hypothetical protein KDD63_13295, partial [Bacteroidetes bacterium]|nr:hypothetical protein [Bacteroidota bacterium]